MTEDLCLNLGLRPSREAAEVDAARERFAADWAAGRRPRIEDELLGVAESIRGPLLAALIEIELESRAQTGNGRPRRSTNRRFPTDSATITAAFAPLTVTAPVRDGPVNQIGKFDVIRLLGAGGQAETYLAFDPDLRHRSSSRSTTRRGPAISRKPCSKRARRWPGSVVRTSPNATAPAQAGLAYLVMEYVPGRTLSQALHDRPPRLADSLRLVEQVAEGLAAVHACGLLHRDVKPSNILIGDDGLPKLIDLGLASPLASDALREISGTFPYMSPEQARGQVERIDARSDVFGLGAVLYELLTGRPPYRGRDLDDIWDQAREGRVTAPRELKHPFQGRWNESA